MLWWQGNVRVGGAMWRSFEVDLPLLSCSAMWYLVYEVPYSASALQCKCLTGETGSMRSWNFA